MYYLVKARIDLAKLPQLAAKIENSELNMEMIKSTYCLKDQPDVGISLWHADNKDQFEEEFAQHKEFYAEVISLDEVIESEEAKQVLVEEMS